MVYTLPPPSNRSEAMEVSDDDLSEEVLGELHFFSWLFLIEEICLNVVSRT